ncbi:serine hydrolase [Nordella sp. HKS 07]|uniref:serine hydrolase domain-containing protein n=1 Tax=Nordella sp. HKS 07 TaxID=2712222 RepID=UPI0013E15355|nr:serine hydrolase [Nordella sp. HKS 07]QIG49731.1 serine hydrolase [Nordella sp. HKS 07]
MRLILCLVLSLVAAAQAGAEPAEQWLKADETAMTRTISGLVQVYSIREKPTALMVVEGDKIIASWGALDRKINVASVRKSLLSALYGIAIAEHRISLTSTLADLRIDDKKPSLNEAEKQATVRDLLTSRSGIYHLAAHETREIKSNRPARGSHAPGTYWFYNNWDFNALGAIYRKETGEDIFASFATRIARPIGMEDFSKRDGRYAFEKVSVYPAYPFQLTARDAARFGLLFANGGRWNGRQVIPAAWVRESTWAHARTNRGNRGYGYMWWELSSEPWGRGGAYAAGFGGQIIAFLPAKKLVLVQTVDLRANPKGIRTSAVIELMKEIAAALPE